MRADIERAAQMVCAAAEFDWTWSAGDLPVFCDRVGWQVHDFDELFPTATTDLEVDCPDVWLDITGTTFDSERGLNEFSFAASDSALDPEELDEILDALVQQISESLGQPTDRWIEPTRGRRWELPVLVVTVMISATSVRVGLSSHAYQKWCDKIEGWSDSEDPAVMLAQAASEDAEERDYGLDRLERRLNPEVPGPDDEPDELGDQPDDGRLAALCAPGLLDLALRPGWPDQLRLLRLVTTTAGRDEYATPPFALWSDTELAPDTEPANRHEVRRAIGRALPGLHPLLDDPDAEVRIAVLDALSVCTEEWETVVPALLTHARAETEPKIRTRILGFLDVISLHWPAHATRLRLADRFTEMLWSAADPIERLTALSHLLVADPQALPGRVESTVLGAVREASESNSAQDATAFPRWIKPTRAVYERLDARPDEQLALVESLFTVDNLDGRGLARELAGDLISTWRTDYFHLLEPIAEQLAEAQLWKGAADALADLGTAAAPVADRILENLDRLGRPTEWTVDTPFSLHTELPWLSLHPDTPSMNKPGPMLRAAAHTGDPRAVPAVRWALEVDPTPCRLDDILAPLGAHAIELVPLIRERMIHTHTHRDGDMDFRSCELAGALGHIGEPAASAATDVAGIMNDRNGDLVEVLGQFGVAARSTIKTVRSYLDHDQLDVRLSAAITLWRCTGDPGPALRQLPEALAEVGENFPAQDLRAQALTAVADLGFAAADCVPALQRLIELDVDPWTTTGAATALWRVTAAPEPTIIALLELSTRTDIEIVTDPNRRRRAHWLTGAAECFAEIGPPAAAAAPLLSAELARPRRRRGSVPADIELCRACRRALDAIFTDVG
ncbi:DUF6301 family protein [Nocardia sp. NPDC051052]|uniref:DUF6301 family protein n=1 Tax=Nocardia sp. NPDC051052 TaxID=3364322 RepID=UPI003788B469